MYPVTVYGKTFKGGNFHSSVCTKHYSLEKISAVHQAEAIMYCTQQMIQGENFRDWLKNHESFPPRKFCHIQVEN